ncbi:similar to Saccharomyces cerevisiae YCR071C IMG2 Mitochondrial ribosomal protein of the large subunit [Maudiozyma barnettii]|uniref:Large ribosomal subunit protein mL49 n=1 Tax=Maudiozyma barnettii TaxID=61262 RepID=A0A8H2ZK25_9SACH|nr:mitochondrial 54S ribosomal protein IMG2 [Kazachstania barnettii]CAB4254767.1 similar to Saccharomyces cerevisiae YCR071C IMG2 Mitochondrial ribosomal protein of the large subunit [Kazachstania barnettii]CAD1782897.1 similar to Saccharomyces cerevisiae YCR071C IMG2 Mitochondrial ribosomal protein of the large subunit [Kazachstania barnettii]
MSVLGGRCRQIVQTGIRFQSTVATGKLIATNKGLFPKLEDISMNELISEQIPFEKGKYFISRSKTGNLPVYSDTKGGGNKLITEIRKIQGDVIQLRNDLREQLPFIPEKNWKVLTQSRKIIIKGDAVKQVKGILTRTF